MKESRAREKSRAREESRAKSRESRAKSRESRARPRCARGYEWNGLLWLWTLSSPLPARYVWICLVWLLTLDSGLSILHADVLQRRQAQQRARELAVKMTAGVLDTQLRILQENKLTDLPLYGEIRELQGNIDQLVTNEMQQVLNLLVAPKAAGESSQGLRQSRQLVRQIVVALLAERHKVRRRLQVSRTNALVRQLLQVETSILETTRTLSSRPPARRDVETIETLQDQRDAQAIYSQLVSALQDTSTWGGQLAADAAGSMEVLETARVELHLESAVAALSQAQFRIASDSQQAVIEGLRALLRRIEASQGLGDAARDDALKLVRELIQEQQRVQNVTRSEELDADSARDLLGGQQRAIDQQLGSLAERLPRTGAFAVLVAQARRASRGAEQSLFEADKPAALNQQDQVLALLGRIQRQLQLAKPQTKKREQFEDQRQALEQLDQSLGDLMNLQSEVTELSGPDPAAAADKEQQVAEALANADQLQSLPEAIQASLDRAQESVADAQTALQNAAADSESVRKEAAKEAEDSLRDLAAEVKASLDEMTASAQSDQETEGQPSSESSGDSDAPAAQGGPESKQKQEEESRSNQGTGQTPSSQPTDSRTSSSTADSVGKLRGIESEAWVCETASRSPKGDACVDPQPSAARIRGEVKAIFRKYRLRQDLAGRVIRADGASLGYIRERPGFDITRRQRVRLR